jgi:glycosyltransferase involved in cell wall biosynthesis
MRVCCFGALWGAIAVRRNRILFLIYRLAQGGAEQQLLELVRGIDKEKFEVIIGCFIPGGEKWQEFNSIPNVRIICFDQKHRFNFFILIKMLRFLRENPVEIIHAYAVPVSIFGILAGLLAKTPVLILGERGRASFATIGSRIYFKLDAFLGRYADCIIANSEAGRQARIRFGVDPKKVVIVQNGLNPMRLEQKVRLTKTDLNIEDGCKIIGNVARLDPIKDHLSLLKSIKLVQEEYPRVKCILVGEGLLRQQLEQFVDDISLRGNVFFMGHRDNIGDFIKLFDIAVLSSKYEGCSNFIIEAMACGKPVVATDVGGNSELVVNGLTGLLVKKEDPRALASAVLRLLKDEQLRVELGNAGQQRAKQEFMLEQMVRETERIYRKLISETQERNSCHPAKNGERNLKMKGAARAG